MLDDEKLSDLRRALKHATSIKELWFKKVAEEVSESGPQRTGYPFITISRQGGAGGHTLAEAVFREMEKRKDQPIFQSWQIFDNELCQMVMNDERLKVTLEFLMTEHYRSEAEDFWAEFLGNESPQQTVIKEVFKCVRTLARVGKVIIVGRAGACLTRDLPGGVRVRLVAPLHARVRSVMESMNVKEPDAKKIVEGWDHDRAKLIKTFFNRNIDDPLLYDVTWNTEQVPMEAIAAAIAEMVRQKAKGRPL